MIFPLSELSQLTEALLNNIKTLSGKNVVYVDYPLHKNIGDHLIYWGAQKALELNNNCIVGEFHSGNYFKKAVEDLVREHNAIIVCHGGGNFGDLYPKHQEFRLQVIADFQGCEIVVFPQSVYFESLAEQERQLAFFSQPNVTVHVRDNESLATLENAQVKTLLTPDCAHMLLDDLHEANAESRDGRLLKFRRRDIEATVDSGTGFDWEDIIGRNDKTIYKAARLSSRLHLPHKATTNLFKWYSRRLMYNAKAHFDQYDVIDTDRLHGFLLAALIGKTIIHSDNSYGKIARYKSAWLKSGKLS